MVKKARPNSPKKLKLAIYVVFMLSWVGAAMIASQLIVGTIMSLFLGREELSQPIVTALYSAFSYLLMLFLVIGAPICYYLKTMNKQKSKTKIDEKIKAENRKKVFRQAKNILGLRGLPTWTDIGLAIVGFIVSLIVAMGLVALFSLFPWFDASESQNVGYGYYLSGMNRVIAFIALVVIAPIAEELVFRGWLYGKLRIKTSKEASDLASIFISSVAVSLLFGVMHFQWNVGVNVFAMSLILCGLREITGTIYAGILMHMIKNGLAFYYLYVLGV